MPPSLALDDDGASASTPLRWLFSSCVIFKYVRLFGMKSECEPDILQQNCVCSCRAAHQHRVIQITSRIWLSLIFFYGITTWQNQNPLPLNVLFRGNMRKVLTSSETKLLPWKCGRFSPWMIIPRQMHVPCIYHRRKLLSTAKLSSYTDFWKEDISFR